MSGESRLRSVYYQGTRLALMFLVASFTGWVYEICCTFIIFGKYSDRGVLHLPFCPIYGFGLLILYCIFGKVKNPLAVFCGSVLITTAVEYLAYMFFMDRYGIELWSYEGWPLNYKGRISAISSCIFGLMALFQLFAVRPLTERIYASKKKNAAAFGVVVFLVFCIVWELTH